MATEIMATETRVSTEGAASGGLAGLMAAIGSIAAVGLAFSITLPLLALTLEDRGISSSWIGINTAFWGLASLAVTPFISRMASAVGTAQLLAFSIAVLALCLPLFYLSPFWIWFPLRLVAGTAVTITFVLSEFWISSAAPPEKRGLVMGIYATVLSAGFALGPLMLSLTGTRTLTPFLAGAAVLLVGVLPVLAGLKVAPRLSNHAGGGFARFLLLAPVATGAALLFGCIEAGAFALLPLYGQRVGHDRDLVILLGIAVTIGNILLQLPMGLLSDRLNRPKLLCAIALFGLAGTAVIPLVASDFRALMLVLCLWGGGVGGLYPVGLAHLAARFTGETLASANAAFIFCYSLGGLIGPAIIGLAMDEWKPHGYTAALALFFIAYLSFALVSMRRSGEA